MKLFMNKAQRELEAIVGEIDANLSNNYKSTAHAAREKLGKRTEQLYCSGALDEKKYKKYMGLFEQYTVMMKNYHH
ncbi:MAG TPA: hypothetical protein PLT66_01345 [Bacillota bacterium]|nr:hypothetical protein [Bacillota bacterium]